MSKVYDYVNELILKELEAGVIPWNRPWSKGISKQGYYSNPLSGTEYKGVNPMLCAIHAYKAGYDCPYYATYKQIEKAGGKVNKGSKSTMITYFQFIESKTEKDKKGNPKKIPMLKYYNAFNLMDTTDIEIPEYSTDIEITDPVRSYEQGPMISFLPQDRAYYLPITDSITLPEIIQFKNDAGFYSTLYHEIGHSTGHSTRLDRNMTGSFGSTSYAKEELIAEVTAAYLCHRTGIELQIKNTASYIANWKNKIKSDKRCLISAFNQASKAVEYVMERSVITSDSIAV